MVIHAQQPDQERDPPRVLPGHACILLIPCRPDIVPEEVPEEHVVQLVPDEVIHFAGVVGVDSLLVRFLAVAPGKKEGRVAVLLAPKIRCQPGKIARIIFVHRRIRVGADDHRCICRVSQKDKHDGQQGEVEHLLPFLV